MRLFQGGSTGHFSEHFMIDTCRGSREKLLDRALVQQCLDELPEKLGMRKLADPTVHWATPTASRTPAAGAAWWSPRKATSASAYSRPTLRQHRDY